MSATEDEITAWFARHSNLSAVDFPIGIVGSLVAYCEKDNRKLSELRLDEFKQHCGAVEADVYGNLGAASVADKYVTEGSAGPKQAKRQIAYWSEQLEQR